MSWVEVKCKCGHKADLMAFTRTLVFGDLPAGHFQCPKCGHAWQRKESGYRLLTCGGATTIIADRVEVITIERRM